MRSASPPSAFPNFKIMLQSTANEPREFHLNTLLSYLLEVNISLKNTKTVSLVLQRKITGMREMMEELLLNVKGGFLDMYALINKCLKMVQENA